MLKPPVKVTRNYEGLFACIAFAAPFVLFINTTFFGHLIWDDTNHIFENYKLTGNALASIPSFFTDFHDRVFGLTFTLWALVTTAFGVTNDWPFHLINVLLHSTNVFLVYQTLYLVFKDKKSCLITALVFAVHPLVVEPVAWISGTKDLLSTFFALSSMYLYLSWVKKYLVPLPIVIDNSAIRKSRTDNKTTVILSGLIHYLLIVLLFISALLSKPTTILLPLSFLIIAVSFLGANWKKALVSILPIQICAMPFVIMTMHSQSELLMDYIVPFFQRPFVAMDACAFYLLKWILPINLYPDYSRNPQMIFENGIGYVSWIVPAVILGVLFFYQRRTKKPVLAGIFCFFVLLLPVSGIVPFDFQDFSTVADRYVYFPFIGICFFLTCAIQGLPKKYHSVVLIVILVFAGRSFAASQSWKSNDVFFSHAIQCNPKSAGMQMHKGLYLAKKGDYQLAFSCYQKALQIKPNYQEAHLNFGVALANASNFDDALKQYNEALRIKPTAELFNDIGTAYAQKGDLNQAILFFQKAIASSPTFVESLCNLGYALILTGNKEQGKKYLENALKIRPRYQEAISRLKLLDK